MLRIDLAYEFTGAGQARTEQDRMTWDRPGQEQDRTGQAGTGT